MSISASQVRDLREKTGVGMMQCKKALQETDGDMEKAVELLRKRGEAVAAKRADKAADEGVVFLGGNDKMLVAAELGCETDFVGASDDFQALGKEVVAVLESKEVADIDALLTESAGDLPLGERLKEVVAKLGENIGVKHIAQVATGAGELATSYSHMGGRIGVIVKLAFEGTPSDEAALTTVARDLAMQVAATNPVAINGDEVSADVLDKERAIYRDQALQEGTKEEFVDRVVEGRIKKYLKEICLADQMFVKDNKKSITALLKEVAGEQGLSSLSIAQFVRMEVGGK
jgi:elongation factor Ts